MKYNRFSSLQNQTIFITKWNKYYKTGSFFCKSELLLLRHSQASQSEEISRNRC